MTTLNSRELLELYRHGRSDAATAIFDRYVARLMALARSRIAPKLQAHMDPDDVVQSAFRSFFVHASNDAYHLAETGDLWRLLASITLNKLYGQVDKWSAAKRSVSREAHDQLSDFQLEAPDPLPEEIAAAAEELERVMDSLTPDERHVLLACLQFQSPDETETPRSKSPRTLRRRLSKVKRKLEKQLLALEESAVERSEQELHAPHRYSDYVLEKLVGAGGMGKVFRARDKRNGDLVAIKSLHKSRQADARAVAQLVHESQMLARLSHPSIVKVRGLGRFPGGGYFMVMDFVDGADLQSFIHKGPLPLASLLRIAMDVASAVQYAHEQGIVHCDIKPGNVLLAKDGQVFVTDFGFAYLVAQVPAVRRGSIGGTADYLAPEVLLGKSKPSPAADIYSLGTLMWALATGRTVRVEEVEWSHPELAQVHAICRRCRAPEPEDRYRSVTVLAADLEALLLARPGSTIDLS